MISMKKQTVIEVPDSNESLLTYEDVARKLNCSDKTVRRMPDSVLPRIRLSGTLVRFRPEDLARLIAA